jgi:glycosyltransferase involved in cell wall biosynthesis
MRRDPLPTVALVTDAVFPWHRGGKELRYHEVARRLAEHADVHVYTMNWWRGAGECRDGEVTFHAISPLLPLYSGERRSVRQALVFALCCLKLLWARFDVIEADHMPYIQLFPLRLVASLRRKRLVVTWHESWGPRYWREYIGAAGLIGWWFERAAMRLPDAIIAASEQTAARLRGWLDESVPVTVAPNGVDLEQIRLAEPAPEQTDLVVVGRLLEHKRIDLLIDTVALLRADGTPVTCRVIGDGPEREALHEQARALHVQDLIDFRHDVASQDELYALLKAARVFVFPSAREGFGIAVLEALACGLSVVTTSAPDNLARHLVNGASRGIVCEPRATAMADAIMRVLGQQREPTASGEPLDAWLREFHWGSVTERVAGVMLPKRGTGG